MCLHRLLLWAYTLPQNSHVATEPFFGVSERFTFFLGCGLSGNTFKDGVDDNGPIDHAASECYKSCYIFSNVPIVVCDGLRVFLFISERFFCLFTGYALFAFKGGGWVCVLI